MRLLLIEIMKERNVGNSRTRSVQRKHDDWYYLERLPSRLREALNTSAFEYDSKWFYDHWNNGKSVDWCIRQIKEHDMTQALEDVKWRVGFKWIKNKSSTKETKIKPLYR